MFGLVLLADEPVNAISYRSRLPIIRRAVLLCSEMSRGQLTDWRYPDRLRRANVTECRRLLALPDTRTEVSFALLCCVPTCDDDINGL
ncbi:hypothetical protein TWF106_011397 [Orbilia oligospora]|uniref:Uncharacterized protein n=1 Tax=Orbilia oligospora TaxID=2813651 RepID=A0A7C8QDJ5_ORBOL|nr:hypothetical protein TWF788_010295 [Orbilia oligospora]KAF3208501.1 hypothetical protein TWF106_011397 [Orbilia oligospora]